MTVVKLTKDLGTEALMDILDKEITVYEDIQGSKIWVNWDGSKIRIRAKSINSGDINFVDLAMQKYYNNAFNYFNSLEDRVKGFMSKNWWFGFEYFPDESPANIIYNRVPKNNLVLTCINKKNKFIYDFDELYEYSKILNVDSLPIIFRGVLSDEKKIAIIYFLNTSEKDLEYVFGDRNFAYFFYKLLNPRLESSFLMEDDFQSNLEKIVIRTKDEDISFNILNPLYKRVNIENATEFTEIYSLLLYNFLIFSQSLDLKLIPLKSTSRDMLYVEMICYIFNQYMANIKEDINNFNFTIPEFFNKEKFKINTELINNKKTIEFIKNPKIEYYLKIILGSFKMKRKKPIGIFTEKTVELMNNFIDEINLVIDFKLNKLREVSLSKTNMLNFGDFFTIKYDVDGDGKVYPDVWKDMDNISNNFKKDKSKNDDITYHKKDFK